MRLLRLCLLFVVALLAVAAQARDRLTEILVTPDGLVQVVLDQDNKPQPKQLSKFRVMLPRDGALRLRNGSGQNITVRTTQGDIETESQLQVGGLMDIPAADVRIQISLPATGDVVRARYTIELMAARKLEVLTRVGASLIGAADNVDRWTLQKNADGQDVITRADSTGFDANLAGLIYIAFDDEGPLSWNWGGIFNPEHHRFGLMIGIGTSQGSDLSYQAGLAWFLDREARSVISFGITWRRSEELLNGLQPGDIWDQAGPIPVRRVWQPALFLGISFNIGN